MALSGAHFTKSRGSDGADVLQTHLRTDATHRVSRKLFVCLESCHDKEQNVAQDVQTLLIKSPRRLV